VVAVTVLLAQFFFKWGDKKFAHIFRQDFWKDSTYGWRTESDYWWELGRPVCEHETKRRSVQQQKTSDSETEKRAALSSKEIIHCDFLFLSKQSIRYFALKSGMLTEAHLPNMTKSLVW